MASKRRQSLYPKKTVQGTHYITREAAEKLRKAMARSGRPGRKTTASDVINFCLMRSADEMTREAVAGVAPPDAAGA